MSISAEGCPFMSHLSMMTEGRFAMLVEEFLDKPEK